jgi:hypothetical protein
LLPGADPEKIEVQLVLLSKYPGLLCKPTWTCDRYYYFLGLSAELAGDTKTAVSAYLPIWWDYWLSPYATMVRLKLRQLYVPTPTPTLSPTPTTTQLVVPTTTGMPTAIFATFTPTQPNATSAHPTPTPTRTLIPTGTNPYPPPVINPSATSQPYP